MDITKQMRNTNDDDVTIDGAAGNAIPGKFSEVFKDLYNRGFNEEKVNQVYENMKHSMIANELIEADKISSVTVKESVEKIKANKSDPLFDFSSDCLKNAPNILYEHLAKAKP